MPLKALIQQATLVRAAALLSAACLVACPAFAHADTVDAVVYPFALGNEYSVGILPAGQLVQGFDGNFYGVTQTTTGNYSQFGGAVYRVTPAGRVGVLYNFAKSSVVGPPAQPVALTLGNDGNLYGITQAGGATATDSNAGQGTIFKLTPTGEMTVLHNFHPTDGYDAVEGLTQGPDGALYGVTESGGAYYDRSARMPGDGVLFRCTTHGHYTVLHSFNGMADHIDGAAPSSRPLFGGDGRIYGTCETGGAYRSGVVYVINADGTGETILHTFAPQTSMTDGYFPEGNLVQDASGLLYGETFNGGATYQGVLYKIAPTGGDYAVIHSFADGSVAGDVAHPHGGLAFGGDGNLYGVGEYSLANPSYGAVFKSTPGGKVSIVRQFTDYSTDITFPRDPLLQGNDGALYSVGEYDGNAQDDGALYKIATTLPYASGSVASLSLSKPAATGGGEHVDGRVTLAAPAGPGGMRVKLQTSSTDKTVIDPYVFVPEGRMVADFRVTTRPVSAPLAVTVTASASKTVAAASLVVTPGAPLASLTADQSGVVGGSANPTLTIILAAPAPAGGETVAVTTSDNNAADVPLTVRIPAGATTATFQATTNPVNKNTSVTISANSAGSVKSVTLTVDGAS